MQVQSHILFLFKNFDICSSWIFVLILIFKNIALENSFILITEFFVFFLSPLKFCTQGKFPAGGPTSCPEP